ncbi:hypothetical protein [Pendulispora albinea]|uniref:Uncharacterized protein n=1 Tax=Pendulispora albinea TaxID=2741071 RepID=A0ABZ2M216_9BACT
MEKGVQVSKETAKGIEEGVEKGRKSGESVDGAVIVSSGEELKDKGSLRVYAVNKAAGAEGTSEVVLAAENTLDKPLRLTKLEFTILDREGFVKRPASVAPRSEVTVPSKAKEKITVTVTEPPERLGKLRVYGLELDLVAAVGARAR